MVITEKQIRKTISFTDPATFDKSDESIFAQRYKINREYVNSLGVEELLQNYYVEAGIRNWNHFPEDCLGGWENPVCQLRGHFTGHWLSACARIYAQTGDDEIYGKACRFLKGLEECQEANGGQWAGSIPEKYFRRLKDGKSIWAPHYTVHKLLMGLIDMKKFCDNDRALRIADRFADWFIEWTAQFDRDEMDRILNTETGGMLEAWADLYEITGDEKYMTLIDRYYRRQFFERLLDGEDPLTLRHANTTVPEIHGCARAYEVTGDEKFKRICENYWNQAVTERGYFATGGQTSGEVWTPKQMLANRLSRTNQEHCTVYNMIRLADYLYRWSGDVKYPDYIERNIYNGILAQQNPVTGMVIYYLPLHAGARKNWGTPRDDFWCCHGSLVQAHTLYARLACYTEGDVLTIAQFIPGYTEHNGARVKIDYNNNYDGKAELSLTVTAAEPVNIPVKVRIPWWAPEYSVNGNDFEERPACGFAVIPVSGTEAKIDIIFKKEFAMIELPGETGTFAFMSGAEVLAAITDHDQVITVPKGNPRGAFRVFDENNWHPQYYHLIGQGLKFVPIHTVTDEKYTVYFPIKEE